MKSKEPESAVNELLFDLAVINYIKHKKGETFAFLQSFNLSSSVGEIPVVDVTFKYLETDEFTDLIESVKKIIDEQIMIEEL